MKMLKIKDSEGLIKQATNSRQPCEFDERHLKHITAVFFMRKQVSMQSPVGLL